MTPPLSIVHVASEMTPIVKVGGLGDVVASLSAEQARRGHGVTVALPAYASAQIGPAWTRQTLGTFEVPWGMGHEPATFRLLSPVSSTNGDGGLRVLLVGHQGERRFFDRPGIYDDPSSGQGYADNGERFLF